MTLHTLRNRDDLASLAGHAQSASRRTGAAGPARHETISHEFAVSGEPATDKWSPRLCATVLVAGCTVSWGALILAVRCLC